MNIRELQSALEYSREQLFQAEKRLDTATEPELIDSAIYEQMAWEKRCEFYNRKLKEAVAGGQALQRNGLVYFGGKR
jgi:hypothetical protein